MHLTNYAFLIAGVLPALSFVIPDEQVSNQVFLGHPAEDPNPPADEYPKAIEKPQYSSAEHFRAATEGITKWHHALERLAEKQAAVKDTDPQAAIDDAFEVPKLNRDAIPESYEYWDSDAWVSHYENSMDALVSSFPYEELHHHHHHDHYEPVDEDGPPYHRGLHAEPPHHRPSPPYHPPMPLHCPRKPYSNSTLLDLISHSKYTTILYELVRKDEELTKILNDTHSNSTLFAPNNDAFKRLPHDPHNAPKDLVRRVLLYHLVNGTHGLRDMMYHNTLITKLPEDELGKEVNQRLRVGLGLQGPTINFFSKIVKANIFAKNGVIHAVDSLLLPPPTALELVEVFPTVFSTSELAFRRTGLVDELKKPHNGFTLFLPSNDGWKRLGLKLNAFLFSDAGKKCLEALMKYHIVIGHTLYTDAHVVAAVPAKAPQSKDYHDPSGLPQGHSHVLLPTMFRDWNISADITRFGRFLSFRVNKVNSIEISDGISKNGVIHVPDHVLIPPCKKHKKNNSDQQPIEEMDVETLQACLQPVIESEV